MLSRLACEAGASRHFSHPRSVGPQDYIRLIAIILERERRAVFHFASPCTGQDYISRTVMPFTPISPRPDTVQEKQLRISAKGDVIDTPRGKFPKRFAVLSNQQRIVQQNVDRRQMARGIEPDRYLHLVALQSSQVVNTMSPAIEGQSGIHRASAPSVS
jgi:hypothetical protein